MNWFQSCDRQTNTSISLHEHKIPAICNVPYIPSYSTFTKRNELEIHMRLKGEKMVSVPTCKFFPSWHDRLCCIEIVLCILTDLRRSKD